MAWMVALRSRRRRRSCRQGQGRNCYSEPFECHRAFSKHIVADRCEAGCRPGVLSGFCGRHRSLSIHEFATLGSSPRRGLYAARLAGSAQSPKRLFSSPRICCWRPSVARRNGAAPGALSSNKNPRRTLSQRSLDGLTYTLARLRGRGGMSPAGTGHRPATRVPGCSADEIYSLRAFRPLTPRRHLLAAHIAPKRIQRCSRIARTFVGGCRRDRW